VKQEGRCSFFSNRGLHKVGMWMHECGCGASSASFDCLGFPLIPFIFRNLIKFQFISMMSSFWS